jgi:hypothetical protein
MVAGAGVYGLVWLLQGEASADSTDAETHEDVGAAEEAAASDNEISEPETAVRS